MIFQNAPRFFVEHLTMISPEKQPMEYHRFP